MRIFDLWPYRVFLDLNHRYRLGSPNRDFARLDIRPLPHRIPPETTPDFQDRLGREWRNCSNNADRQNSADSGAWFATPSLLRFAKREMFYMMHAETAGVHPVIIVMCNHLYVTNQGVT